MCAFRPGVETEDFYEEPQPGFMDYGEEGLLLQFSANGRNISDYLLDRSDIEFIHEELGNWLKKHPEKNADKEKILQLIEQKKNNKKKIDELTEENKRLTKLISSDYIDYLKEEFSKPDEWYICVNTWSNSYEFFHVGKFKFFSFLGEKDKKRLPNYSNDYMAHFEFIDGFTTNLNRIARNNLYIAIIETDPHFEIDSDHQDGIARFNHNGIGRISKDLFEKEKQKILKEVDKCAKASFNEYNCGDQIEYANKNGIFTGKIVMIKGKSAFLSDGTKVNLSTPRVKKI